MAVREALMSAFQNIYAEGYPERALRWMSEEEILDHPMRLAEYRRNGDPRYYKGVEYADAVEALARRRAAEAFAANGFTADQIYVNVQALSGGPANNAVYQALLNIGDTVMGLTRRMAVISRTVHRSTAVGNGSRQFTTLSMQMKNSITKPSVNWRWRTSPNC